MLACIQCQKPVSEGKCQCKIRVIANIIESDELKYDFWSTDKQIIRDWIKKVREINKII